MHLMTPENDLVPHDLIGRHRIHVQEDIIHQSSIVVAFALSGWTEVIFKPLVLRLPLHYIVCQAQKTAYRYTKATDKAAYLLKWAYSQIHSFQTGCKWVSI